jgi:hypothetical protein
MSSQFTCSFVSIHNNGGVGGLYIYIYNFFLKNCDIEKLEKKSHEKRRRKVS